MKYKATANVIVLGLGAHGSSALYQLARQGKNVLGIDRYRPPHCEGSSHGESRITRLAIGEGEFYTPYALRSHEIWHELEREFGAQLLTKTGGLVIGMPGKITKLHGKVNFFNRTVQAAKLYGGRIAHEVLDAPELRRRFPQLSVRDDELGYYEEEAGVLHPERCVETHLRAAKKHGATIDTGVRIGRICQTRNGALELHAFGGAVYACERLVIALGPWVSKFLPESNYAKLRVYRQVLQWFRPMKESSAQFAVGKFPVFIWERESFYGFSNLGSGEIKVASGEYGIECDPERVDRSVNADVVLDMRARLARSIPSLAHGELTRTLTCLYTGTPDGNFIVDRHPTMRNALLVSACSGHGFKHSPAIGELAAKLVSDNRLAAPKHFSFSRF